MFVVSFSSVLLTLVFILIDTFFLLYYRRLIIRFLVAVFKEENSVIVYDVLAQIQSRIRQYILGLLLEIGDRFGGDLSRAMDRGYQICDSPGAYYGSVQYHPLYRHFYCYAA